MGFRNRSDTEAEDPHVIPELLWVHWESLLQAMLEGWRLFQHQHIFMDEFAFVFGIDSIFL